MLLYVSLLSVVNVKSRRESADDSKANVTFMSYFLILILLCFQYGLSWKKQPSSRKGLSTSKLDLNLGKKVQVVHLEQSFIRC